MPAAALAQSAPQSVTIQSAPSQSDPNANDHSSKPLPLKPAVPGTGRNLRLILKDGSYQMVRDYQIAGDRVRYLSQERGEWEELPKDLVDWDATNKWAKEHDELVDENSSPAMKEAANIDAEETEERGDEKARRPQVAPGVELPDEDGVFVLDTFHGTPELVELKANDLSLNTKNRKGGRGAEPACGPAGKHGTGRRERSSAPARRRSGDLSFAGSRRSNRAGVVAPDDCEYGRRKGRERRQTRRSLCAIGLCDRARRRAAAGADCGRNPHEPHRKCDADEDQIPTKAEVLPGKHWLKIEPAQTLTIGEYALVEIISPSDISESVWDFRVDPAAGRQSRRDRADPGFREQAVANRALQTQQKTFKQ
ncbi:MAG: hypothetical protein WDM87_15285 [Terracidiphilus sp.]